MVKNILVKCFLKMRHLYKNIKTNFGSIQNWFLIMQLIRIIIATDKKKHQKTREKEEKESIENWSQIQTLTEEGWRNRCGILERPSSLEESCDPPKPRFSRMVSGSSFLDSRKLSTPALEALEAAESEAKEATRSPLLKASRRLSCTSHTSSSGCCGLSNTQRKKRAQKMVTEVVPRWYRETHFKRKKYRQTTAEKKVKYSWACGGWTFKWSP